MWLLEPFSCRKGSEIARLEREKSICSERGVGCGAARLIPIQTPLKFLTGDPHAPDGTPGFFYTYFSLSKNFLHLFLKKGVEKKPGVGKTGEKDFSTTNFIKTQYL